MNIPSAILQLVGSGNTANSISSILGLSEDQTRRATGAAVPSLLAGLTGLASSPQGAEQLANVVSRQDTGVVDNLNGALSGQGARLAEQGSGILGSLMGGGMTSKLGSVLSRFTGVGEGATGKLLGLLAPIIMGFLGKQQRASGLSASGLASLLTSQKDNIRSAMPAGLDTAISSALPGFGGQLFGDARTAAAEPRRTYEESTARAKATSPDWKPTHPVHAEAHHGGAKRWTAPLLIALAALAAFMLWSNRDKARQASVGAPTTAPETVTGGGASSFVSDTARLVNQASSTLAGVKDTASADAAVPKLKQINDQLGGLRANWNKLPEATRSSAATALQPQIERLKDSAQPVLSQPGIGDTLRPQVDQLMQHLRAFSSP